MAGMGDGYVGTAQDAVRIRRLEKQREAERRKIQELKSKTASSKGEPGLLQFGSSTSEILETAFKKDTVGLVTREQYVEKRVNIRNKIEEEEKEKLLKLQQEEEELQLQKLKKRKIKADPRLSFSDDIQNDEEEEHEEPDLLGGRKFGKDPTVGTGFLPDSEREAEEQAERERLQKQWLHEQEQIKNEPLEITYSYWDGTGHRRVIQVRKGDTIGEFLCAVQQQLASEFREVWTTLVQNLLYVKEDLIIPHQHSFYELIVNKARGKSGPLFHFDVHEDVRTIADARTEKDEFVNSHMLAKLWRDIGMRRTSTYFQLQDGRYMTQRRNGSDTRFMGIDSRINATILLLGYWSTKAQFQLLVLWAEECSSASSAFCIGLTNWNLYSNCVWLVLRLPRGI